MKTSREICQLTLLSLASSCGPAAYTTPDSGNVATSVDAGGDAGLSHDAGEVEADGGTDAGLDAGARISAGWSKTVNAPGGGIFGTVLAYDSVDKRFILHGGNRGFGVVLNDTWSFSIRDQAWTKLTTSGETMPLRYCHCTAYLPQQRQVLIFGGRARSSVVHSAYTLDLQSLRWTKIDGALPAGDIGCNSEWIPALNRVLVFGGDGDNGMSNETWTYDPAARSFEKLMPMNAPAARRDAMTFVERSTGRVLLFAGAAELQQRYFNDLWLFEAGNWMQAMPSMERPTPRRYSASGYDSTKARWVFFGGTNDSDDFADLWTMNPASLEFQMHTLPNGPSARAFSASGLDPDTGTLFIFGGASQTATFADGYTLRLP